MDNFIRMKDNDKREYSANFVFIDYENVSLAGLNGIEKLDEKSIVNIFFSKNTASMPVDLVAKIGNAKSDIRFHEIKPGKNALDFVLSSLLGYFIHDNYQEDFYYIVSKDKGFEPLVEYWKTQKVAVKIVSSLNQIKTNIAKATTKKAPAKKKDPYLEQADKEYKEYVAKLNSTLGQVLKGETKDTRDRVAKIIIMTKSKTAVKNSINQFIKDKQKANNIYTKIGKLIKDKKD